MGINVQGKWYSGSGTASGGKVVVLNNQLLAEVPVGAVVTNPPALGGMIYEGDVAEFDFSTKEAKHLKVFVVAKAVSDTDTKVMVKRGDFYHKLESGLKLCAVPSTLSTAVTGVAVGTVTSEVDSTAGAVYSFAITADAFGELSVGDILLEAAAAGTSTLLLTNPNTIFKTDIYIDSIPATSDDDYDGARYPAALYNAATLYGANISTLPTIIKENLRKGYSDIKILE